MTQSYFNTNHKPFLDSFIKKLAKFPKSKVESYSIQEVNDFQLKPGAPLQHGWKVTITCTAAATFEIYK